MKKSILISTGLAIVFGTSIAFALMTQNASGNREPEQPTEKVAEQDNTTTAPTKGQGRWSAAAELGLDGSGCCGGCSTSSVQTASSAKPERCSECQISAQECSQDACDGNCNANSCCNGKGVRCNGAATK
ncbi:MAG: hypothetical protein KDB27_20215 [Planctomycetales bacterium]|nr:hypothetical protein [Planctomycetales bacterium]